MDAFIGSGESCGMRSLLPMPRLALFLSSAVALLLASCSSTPDKVDSGTVRAQTFSFVVPKANTVNSSLEQRRSVHESVQSAIAANLERRGLRRVGSGGDVTVAYLLIVGNNVSTMTIRDYFGYGREVADLQDKAHEAYTGSKDPNHFKAGTLLIDLVDRSTQKLVWRGHATRPVLQDPDAATRAAQMRGVVDEILARARIGT